ncbi:hypothetical protein BDV19DRAFT_395127 [Aspergillus venezuelensis]
MHFEDGTTAHGNILIGVDGLKSKVRQSFIPDYKLRFTGKVFMRSTFDVSLVEGKVPDLPEDCLHWDNFFASRLGKNQYTTVGAYSDPRPSHEIESNVAWDQKGDVNFLRERYKPPLTTSSLNGWLPNVEMRNWHPLIRALTNATPYTNLYPNFAGDAIPIWVFDSRVTLVGDAAHAHGGAFAAGGSLALDDAFALGLAFRYVSGGGIENALRLHEKARRSPAERLLRIVHGQLDTGKVMPPSNDEEENERLIKRLRNRVDTEWLSEHDVEAAFRDVVATAEKTEGAPERS